MKEELLQFLWKYQLFSKSELQTTNNHSIKIISNGIQNKLAGPDFLNARVVINNQLWAGNIEVHLKSSDWYLHQHEKDVNYNAVILHVVWEEDAEVFGKDNQPIPTLVLQNYVSDALLKNYQQLLNAKKNWIPCQNKIASINRLYFIQWLEGLYVERLAKKSKLIFKLLEESNHDWEAVLFQMIAKNFGLKVNGDAFLQWSQSILFSTVRKEQADLSRLSALFFGQAGFLEDPIENAYYQSLQLEYRYQKHKYKLQAIPKNTFHFFGMRPTNFPTVRLAQLASLYAKYQNLFSKIIALKTKKEVYQLFATTLDDFWLTHYTFSKESPKRKKSISKVFIDLLVVNTLVPLQFTYAQSQNKSSLKPFELLRQIAPEKNNITQKFASLGVLSQNALETQSLLELKNNYCAKKRCLQCAVGLRLLKDD